MTGSPEARFAGLGRVASVGAVVLASLLALTTLAAAAVSFRLSAQASGTMLGQMRLLEARRDVAEAEAALGGADIEDALEGANQANEAARRVGRVTSRIVRLLQPASITADRIAASAEDGLRGARFAGRQSEIAARLLDAISDYQSAAATASETTNRALRRILAALRRTNENFPPGGLP